MIKIISNKHRTYNGVRLNPGDTFMARPSEARILVLLGQARPFVEMIATEPLDIDPVKPVKSPKIQVKKNRSRR